MPEWHELFFMYVMHEGIVLFMSVSSSACCVDGFMQRKMPLTQICIRLQTYTF